MNLKIINVIAIIYATFAVAQGRKQSYQLSKSSHDWSEALDDFKVLVHAISFSEDIPSHHSNPLQIMMVKESVKTNMAKTPFKIPKGWFGKKNRCTSKNKNLKKQKHIKSCKNGKSKKSNKLQSLSSSQLRDHQSFDDLMLLNFLGQLEEPVSRLSIQSHSNQKHLNSLTMAENRYNEIKKKLKISGAIPKKGHLTSSKSLNDFIETDPYKMKASKKITDKVKGKTSNNSGKKQWFERIDAKGVKNTLTLSVAFGVIVTALFCVMVQLFKLFASPKASGSPGAFDQINRRSTYGYDRIALDIEEDEETAQLN